MWRIPININKKLLPMKMHYFLYSGCSATILNFGSTYAKQLGYSKITVAYIMTCLFILSMLTKPVIGAIVDKFHVKKYVFSTFIFSTGMSAFFLMFVSSLSFESSSELQCNTTKMAVKVFFNGEQLSNNYDQKDLMVDSSQKFVNCKLNCSNNELLLGEMFTWENGLMKNVTGTMSVKNKNKTLSVFVQMYNSNPEETNFYDFRVHYADMNHDRLISPLCYHQTKMLCQLNCPYQQIMALDTAPKSQEMILSMPEFWAFFLLSGIFWISNSGIWSIQDPICYDLLGEKSNDFGKQRLWTSIGYGIVSMICGWMVDYFSHDHLQKNYTPMAYLIISFTVLNLICASKIRVTEFKVSKNMCQNVFNLFTKFHVISFFLWIMLLGVYNAMTMGYLFWYLEEMASGSDSNHLPWIKTLQGLCQGVQTFGGEIPMFFCSGWVISKIGHKHCMTLILFAFAIRFFSYSIMTQPVWALLIEILNGMSYALGRAVMVSYSRMISPPSTNHTILGLVGLFDSIGLAFGTPLAGHLYVMFGGVWFFWLYACGSAAMCILITVYNLFAKGC